MMKMTTTITMTLVIAWLSGCGSTPKIPDPQPANAPPQSKQVQFVEQSSSSWVLLSATGKDVTPDAATQDAKKAALWYVLMGDAQALLSTPQLQSDAAPYLPMMYRQVDRYVRNISPPKARHQRGQHWLLTHEVQIDKQALHTFLVEQSVLSSASQLQQQLGLPSLAVTGDRVLQDGLSEFLLDQGYQVTQTEQQQPVNDLIQQAADLSGQTDPWFAVGLSTGADVVIHPQGDVESSRISGGVLASQASVNVSAVDSASGLRLASSQGFSQQQVGATDQALLAEAALQAVAKLNTQLQRAWQRQTEAGQWFKLVVQLHQANEAQDAALYSALQSLNPSQLKRESAGDTQMSYLLQVAGVHDAFDLMRQLQQHYLGSGQLRRRLDSGKLLVVSLGSGLSHDLVDPGRASSPADTVPVYLDDQLLDNIDYVIE